MGPLFLVVGVLAIDALVSDRGSYGTLLPLFDRLFNYEPSLITDATGSLAGVVAAVFGIVITVVSIVVQLSADRYPSVVPMFLHDRTNRLVLSVYIGLGVIGVLASFVLHDAFVPRWTITLSIASTVIGLVLLGPYLSYVFWFLEPSNIISRIQSEARRDITSLCVTDGNVASAPGVNVRDWYSPLGVGDKADHAIRRVEELADIIRNAIASKDKLIASMGVSSLRNLLIFYVVEKHRLPASWFALSHRRLAYPDFVVLDPESRKSIESERLWFEWFVLKQYLGLFGEAIGTLPDVAYLLAIDLRYVGEEAAKRSDQPSLRLVLRHFNSYLRATLNVRDVRSAYNVLNQYRLLAEYLLRRTSEPTQPQPTSPHAVAADVSSPMTPTTKRLTEKTASDVVGFMSYYGLVSYEMNLPFVTETVAYDVGRLCRVADEVGSPTAADMLGAFLKLDQPIRHESQEPALLGIRKAQVKLGAYFQLTGNERGADQIRIDLRSESRDRMLEVERALVGATERDFWEVVDRGQTFEYMNDNEREQVSIFLAPILNTGLSIGDSTP